MNDGEVMKRTRTKGVFFGEEGTNLAWQGREPDVNQSSLEHSKKHAVVSLYNLG